MKVEISESLVKAREDSLNRTFNEFISAPSIPAMKYLLLEMYEYAVASCSYRKMLFEPDGFHSLSVSNIMYFYKDKDISYTYFIESWKEVIDGIRVVNGNDIIVFLFNLISTYEKESYDIFSDIFVNIDIVSMFRSKNLSFIIQELYDKDCVINCVHIFIDSALQELGSIDINMLVSYCTEKLSYFEKTIRDAILDYLLLKRFVVSSETGSLVTK